MSIPDLLLAGTVAIFVTSLSTVVIESVQISTLDKEAAIVLDVRTCRNEFGHRVVCQPAPCQYYPPTRTVPISYMLKENTYVVQKNR